MSYPGALCGTGGDVCHLSLPLATATPSATVSLATMETAPFHPIPPAPGCGSLAQHPFDAGAAVSCLGQFVTEMVVDSYQLRGMAEQGLMPAVFTKRCDVE